MKTVWITSLGKSEDRVKRVMTQLKTYGLGMNGHFWADDLDRMGWLAPKEEMLKAKAALWLVLASAEDLAVPSVRYGLSLLALSLRAERGADLPLLVLLAGQGMPSSGSLPTPLQGASVLAETTPSWPAKVVTQANLAAKPVDGEFRLNVIGDPKIGQWFEVGPAKTAWGGALFGAAGAEIDFHAVGPKGALPERTTLNYAQKGLKLTLGQKEYVAWAVRNDLDPQSSYFVRVKGYPDSILFGPYAEGEQADLYRLSLQ